LADAVWSRQGFGPIGIRVRREAQLYRHSLWHTASYRREGGNQLAVCSERGRRGHGEALEHRTHSRDGADELVRCLVVLQQRGLRQIPCPRDVTSRPRAEEGQ